MSWTPGGDFTPPKDFRAQEPAPPSSTDFTDGEWHRLHPATPLLKGGIVFVVILGIFINNAREQLIGFFIPGPDGNRGGRGR